MNTDLHDDDLRHLLQNADPAKHADSISDGAVDRVWQRLDLSSAPPTRASRRRWWDLALAACAGAALVAGTIVVSETVGGPDSSTSMEAGAPAATELSPADKGSASDAASTPETLARDASAVVAAQDLRAARDAFVATVQQAGGRVTSESTTTDSATGPTPDIYPPPPTVPGVSIAAEVPTQAYDSVVASLSDLGTVVQFTQSTVDMGSEVADTKARIASLRSSVTTLRGLLDQAQTISEVIDLENAIATRQSELDGLVAQQRYLESQVAQARILVQLLEPDDAAAIYGSPSRWDRVTDALGDVWMWVGRVLLWTSPLWVILAGWFVYRRRR